MIIMTQTVVAAGARIDSGTRLDIKAKSDVPVALTPNPMHPKATRHMAKPVP
jgi:formylmethanofuran dehydrogenase subunit B